MALGVLTLMLRRPCSKGRCRTIAPPQPEPTSRRSRLPEGTFMGQLLIPFLARPAVIDGSSRDIHGIMHRVQLKRRRLVPIVVACLFRQVPGFSVEHALAPCVSLDARRFCPRSLPLVRLRSVRDESALSRTEEEYRSSSKPSPASRQSRSRIRAIKASNLAGFVGHDSGDITISFAEESRLIAVTGNSASGKSLLLAKTIDLLCGGKATTSLLNGQESAKVEIELSLAQPHLSAVKDAFRRLQVDAESLLKDGRLTIERTITLTGTNGSSRLRSVCRMNGQPVTLKDMASVARPLLVVVDAAVAAAALAKDDSRLQIIDTGVPLGALRDYHSARKEYKKYRQKRQQLEDELSTQTISKLYSGSNGEANDELLDYYIGELDALETRTARFCESLYSDVDASASSNSIASICHNLATTAWNDSSSSKSGEPFRSSLLEKLMMLRDGIIKLENQLAGASQVVDAVGSLSSSKSAMTAVEQARKLLFGITGKQGAQESGLVDRAAERVHEMLNGIEIALSDCVTFIEDDEGGLVRALETERSSCPVSLDQIDSLIGDWGALSRKHGVSSYELPSCHSHLKQERDGSASLREHIQVAISEEKEKLKIFSRACQQLTTERTQIARQLEKDVTNRLPSLSMENSAFRILLEQTRPFTDLSIVNGASYVDDASFLLLTEGSEKEGSRVHEVASSGEKARLLLAIESSLPGSIGALSRVNSGQATLEFASVLPVAVVYDEIDAHVGGSAANTLASLLAVQSQRSQILAITHSPPVGAVADRHLVVKKRYGPKNVIDGANPAAVIDVRAIEGNERRLELARMASGDMATREAEEFAAALIREGALRRDASG